MIDAKYFRDYKHSYMILPCGSAQPEKNYTCRLLISNKLKEVLCCSLRHVNGAAYFYYDISSRTTLENMYRGRQLSFGQVKDLFEQLYGIYCRLGDHFMDETKLVLLPEYIFYDLSRKKYIGLYYPDYEENRSYEALMDYLLEHMDSQDERLADCVYQIYERAEDSGFSLWDALQILGESEEQGEAPAKETKEFSERRGDIFPFPGNGTSESDKAEAAYTQPDLRDLQVDTQAQWEEKEAVSVPVKRKSSFSLFITTFSVFGIAGIIYIYGTYELSNEEVMTLLGCGALMGICLLAGLIGILKGGAGKGRKGRAGTETEKRNPGGTSGLYLSEQETVSAEYLRNREPVSLEHVLSRGNEAVLPEQVWSGGGAAGLPDTVFFDSTKMVEYKLYALDKKNKKHIELTKFPFTVGKMAGCVDCVLADDSVSRIHARFERVGDTIQLTDMNSTNGTYRNGLRMQPQETVEIEPGDEIRFGNLNYCYR